ncbi:MAG: hypothetical protein QOF11_2281, partial [Chloroflexota bacterium]|nr:hypothetical protein [Chloroflexota bacterium]
MGSAIQADGVVAGGARPSGPAAIEVVGYMRIRRGLLFWGLFLIP